MGPNGSGKSTLAYTLMGHPKYEVTDGTATLNDKDLVGDLNGTDIGKKLIKNQFIIFIVLAILQNNHQY
jgi:Fe-S cluster assembly ATPase SufC